MTTTTLLYWGLGTTGALLGLWAGHTALREGGLDQPSYMVSQQLEAGEVREYAPFLIAKTQPSKKGRPGLNQGFRELAGYIFGKNAPQEKLPMTAPVIQQNDGGESLPMTAPVLTGSTEMMMAFVMPPGRTLEDLPAPVSSKVTLEEIDLGRVAAIRFSGRGKEAKFVKWEAKLRTEVKAAGLTPTGPALYAQYNSPYAFPFLRRNEVLIPVAPPPK